AESQAGEEFHQQNLAREEFLLNHFARIAPSLARVEHGAIAIDTSGSQPLRGNQWGPVYPLRTAFGDARFAQVIDVCRRPNLIRYLLR
ncbi:hypothetical protein, partial [Vibrio cholerae]|uniref:hypothetical protein n=1 Tax=Vibrio cholerae TaxID=666 RepID=UPI001F3A8075